MSPAIIRPKRWYAEVLVSLELQLDKKAILHHFDLDLISGVLSSNRENPLFWQRDIS